MSKEGIRIAAEVFSHMQEARGRLIKLGSGGHGLLDKQDLLLGQLLQIGKDAMKEKFSKITVMKEEEK